MVVSKVVKQGGQGAVLLFIYLVGTALIWFPERSQFEILMAAGIVVFLIAYTIALFNDLIVGFLHWPTIVEVGKEIDGRTENEQFYFDHRENWEKLDEYDDKVYRDTVAVVSGVYISLTLPIQGFYYGEVWALVAALIGAFISSVVFIYKPYNNSRETIMTTVKLYE